MGVTLQLLIGILLLGSQQMVSDEQAQAINPSERKALIALFEKTGGKDWSRKDQWLGPIGTECKWYGVWCRRQVEIQGYGSNTVTELNLSNNGLKGQIPPEMDSLRNLKSLELHGNAIKGPLPDAILQRFDQAQLEIKPMSLVHDLEGILVETDSPAVLCMGVRTWISADGGVRQERERCRKRWGRLTREEYFEYQNGKTYHFDRLARSLCRSGFFSDDAPSIRMGPWFVDGGETSVTVKRSGGVSVRRSWGTRPLSMAEWELEMQIDSVLVKVKWLGKPTAKK